MSLKYVIGWGDEVAIQVATSFIEKFNMPAAKGKIYGRVVGLPDENNGCWLIEVTRQPEKIPEKDKPQWEQKFSKAKKEVWYVKDFIFMRKTNDSA